MRATPPPARTPVAPPPMRAAAPPPARSPVATPPPARTPVAPPPMRAAPPPMRAPPPPVARKPTCVALYDLMGEREGDLSFYAGDVITVYEQNGTWWKGELNGSVGVFPNNYVELQ